jgi:hypothetical protein
MVAQYTMPTFYHRSKHIFPNFKTHNLFDLVTLPCKVFFLTAAMLY